MKMEHTLARVTLKIMERDKCSHEIAIAQAIVEIEKGIYGENLKKELQEMRNEFHKIQSKKSEKEDEEIEQHNERIIQFLEDFIKGIRENKRTFMAFIGSNGDEACKSLLFSSGERSPKLVAEVLGCMSLLQNELIEILRKHGKDE